MSNYADRLKELNDRWKKTKSSDGNRTYAPLPEGSYQCEFKGARMNFAKGAFIFWNFVVSEGEKTGRYVNVMDNLLREHPTFDGLTAFRANCDKLGITIENLDPRHIESKLKEAAKSGILAEIRVKHNKGKDGNIYANGNIMKALNSISDDDTDPFQDEEEESETEVVEEEETVEDETPDGYEIGQVWKFLDKSSGKNRKGEIIKLEEKHAVLEAKVGRGSKKFRKLYESLKPVEDEPVNDTVEEFETQDMDDFDADWGDD